MARDGEGKGGNGKGGSRPGEQWERERRGRGEGRGTGTGTGRRRVREREGWTHKLNKVKQPANRVTHLLGRIMLKVWRREEASPNVGR